jgi:hypothetical protein
MPPAGPIGRKIAVSGDTAKNLNGFGSAFLGKNNTIKKFAPQLESRRVQKSMRVFRTIHISSRQT